MTDPNIRRRNRANKRKGTAWETAIRNYLTEAGLDAERVAKKGSSDIGDVVVRLDDGHHMLIEAKDTIRPQLSEWLREAEVEAENYARHRRVNVEYVHPVVIYKRRSHGVDKAYVVMELKRWMETL